MRKLRNKRGEIITAGIVVLGLIVGIIGVGTAGSIANGQAKAHWANMKCLHEGGSHDYCNSQYSGTTYHQRKPSSAVVNLY